MRILYFIALSLFSFSADAQHDSVTASLDEVIVTGQRTKGKEKWIPYSVKKTGSQYFKEWSPRTTPEALQGMNGVFIQKTNHGGGSAFIRGLTGNQTLILIDGIRLNNSTFRYGPNQYLNTIDPYIIDRIEVAKGTGSVQYGTDALGGVIHVLTKEPVFNDDKKEWQGKTFFKYASGDMERTARGDVNYSSKRLAFTGGITGRHFGDLIGGDTTGKQTPSGYKEWAVNAKLKLLLHNNIQLTLAHQNVDQSHVPVYHKVKLENFALNEFDQQHRQLQYAKLDINASGKWIKKLELILSRQFNIEGRESRKNNSTVLRKERDKVTTSGLTADIFSQPNNWWAINSGVEFYNDKIGSQRSDRDLQNAVAKNSRGLYPDGARYGNYSLYSLHHFNYKNWIGDAGLRWNRFAIQLTDTSLGTVNIHPAALVWNAALMYRLGRHHIYATYSTGYRAPNIDDMSSLGIVDFRYELPANNLSPEKSANMELGYKFETKRLRGDVAFYRMQLNNLITRVKVENRIINGYPVYQKENIEDAVAKGVEAELAWTLNSEIGVTGGLTYTHGQNNTKREPMRRIPPLHGRLMSTYRKGGWFAAAEVLYARRQDRLAQGDKEDNRIPSGGTPGWEVLNFYAGKGWNGFNLNAGLQNIFNQDYRTHGSGINGVGRSGWLAASVTF